MGQSWNEVECTVVAAKSVDVDADYSLVIAAVVVVWQLLFAVLPWRHSKWHSEAAPWLLQLVHSLLKADQ